MANPLTVLRRRVGRGLDATRVWARSSRIIQFPLHSHMLRDKEIARTEPDDFAQRVEAIYRQGLNAKNARASFHAIRRLFALLEYQKSLDLVIAHKKKFTQRRYYDNLERELIEITEFVKHGLVLNNPGVIENYEPIPGRVAYLLHNSLPYHSGGYATRSHGIMQGIAANGYDVFAIQRYGYPYDVGGVGMAEKLAEDHEIDGIHYRPLTRSRPETIVRRERIHRYGPLYAAALEEWCLDNRPAVIHAPSFGINGVVAKHVASRLGIPSVFEVRGLQELRTESFAEALVDTDRERIRNRIEDQAVQEADWVFTLTDALRKRTIARGANPERISLLPNAVNAEKFVPISRNAEVAKQLGLENKVVIGYIGSLVEYEGLELLVDAFAELVKTRDDVALVIAGSGVSEPMLQERAKQHGLLNNGIQFLGRIPHAEVQEYYSVIDICPLPRLPLPICEEVSPLKPFEAMAMGKCVLVSSVAAMAEIVSDGQTGAIFTKGDVTHLVQKLNELIDSPALRESIGQQARAWVVENRTWERITQEVDRVYAHLGVKK